MIHSYGIKILYLAEIVKELRTGKTPIKAASGADLLELMSLAEVNDRAVVEVIEPDRSGDFRAHRLAVDRCCPNCELHPSAARYES